MRRWLLAIAVVAVVLASPAIASHLGRAYIAPDAGVEGGDALILPRGDILNVRNIQGGVVTGRRGDLNLDIGAGNSTHRGDIALQWDVGRCTRIFDGMKRPIASFCPRRIVFYRRVVFRRRPQR